MRCDRSSYCEVSFSSSGAEALATCIWTSKQSDSMRAATPTGSKDCTRSSTSRSASASTPALSAIASIFDVDDADGAEALAEQIVDPLRTFNRFGIPASLLGRVSAI